MLSVNRYGTIFVNIFNMIAVHLNTVFTKKYVYMNVRMYIFVKEEIFTFICDDAYKINEWTKYCTVCHIPLKCKSRK